VTVLIAYCSRYGTTEARARSIGAAVRAEVSIVDLQRGRAPDPERYDVVLIGGSIYGGTIQSRVTAFCESNEEALRNRPVGVFVCCLSRDAHARAQMDDAFPGWLLGAAFCRALPGGALYPGNLTLLDRILVRAVPHPPGIVDLVDAREIAAAAAAVNAFLPRVT